MFDPLTNKSVTPFEPVSSSRRTSYKTFLWQASIDKTENCILLKGKAFVETKCTLTKLVTTAIQCACVQGKKTFQLFLRPYHAITFVYYSISK